MATAREEDVFALVSNVPSSFHSQDLRNYFSQFVEEGRFSCFHFRNRPENKLQKIDENEPLKQASAFRNSNAVNGQHHGASATARPRPNFRPATVDKQMYVADENEESRPETNRKRTEEDLASRFQDGNRTQTFKKKCCIIKISPQNLKRSLQLYHKKAWVDRSGNAMGSWCFIVGIKVSKQDVSSHTFTREDLLKLPELNPPGIMPQGNVGTPTQSFLQLIRDCKIPPSVIKKLGLTFPKRRSNRMYGNVPFHYGGTATPGSSEEGEDIARTGTGEKIINVAEGKPGLRKPVTGETVTPPQRRRHSSEEEQKSDSEEDDDTCEEWERHEALHEDVTKQDRTGERLFEEEMEIVWEKGGSGLVFYTDAAYWDAMKGDFDERTSDDWDVDMSIFEKDGGTKDARDWLQIQREQRRGEDDDTSVFIKDHIGRFESHTKGFGRQLMGQLGWKEGEGLGRAKNGMRDALENEGQTSRDKRGLGYHGEKLCRYPVKRKQHPEGAIISTVYDKMEEIDPPATLLRAVEPSHLKHRKEVL